MQAGRPSLFETDTHLDLHKVNGLHKARLGREHTGIEAPPGGRDYLATSTMDGISMQGHIMHIKANSTHVLFTKGTLVRRKRLEETI